MRKLMVSLAAVAAFTTGAAAHTMWYERDQAVFDSPADYTIDAAGFEVAESTTGAYPAVGSDWLFANGEMVRDTLEARRFDEKN